MVGAAPDKIMSFVEEFRRRAAPFRDVLGFTFAHWTHHRVTVAGVLLGVLIMTMADVLLPIYAGRLIDAVAPAVLEQREAALTEAIWALVAMVALGALMVIMRHLAFVGVCRLTLRVMTRVAQEAFWRVQRFASEWHANTFAGSIVRKVTRGMWAIDLLNDTLLIAFLPSIIVLLGSTVLLGARWPLVR